MAIRVGINGFGRIGRPVLRAIREFHPNEIDVVAFNDLGEKDPAASLEEFGCGSYLFLIRNGENHE